MRKLLSFSIIFIISSIIFVSSASAQTIPSPKGSIYVQDFSTILSTKQREELVKLGEYANDEANIKISLVTVDSLNGLSIDEFARQVAHEYGLDTNGLLLLTAIKERKIRIEVASNLQAIVTDEKAGEILNTYALPYLENNEMANALTNSYKQMFNTVSESSGLNKKSEVKKVHLGIPLLFKVLIFIGSISLLFFIDRQFLKAIIARTIGRLIRHVFIKKRNHPNKRPPNQRPPNSNSGTNRNFSQRIKKDR